MIIQGAQINSAAKAFGQILITDTPIGENELGNDVIVFGIPKSV